MNSRSPLVERVKQQNLKRNNLQIKSKAKIEEAPENLESTEGNKFQYKQ
jgi:hypothetical protein